MPDPRRGFTGVNPDEEPLPELRPIAVVQPDPEPRGRGFNNSVAARPDPLQQTLAAAASVSPDRAAEIFQLRVKTGLPPAVIERNFDEVRKKTAAMDFNPERFRQDNPQLTRFMVNNPEGARIVQDDLEPLSAVERALTVGSNVARSLGAGVWQFAAEAPWSGLEFTGEILEALTGSPRLAMAAREVRKGTQATVKAIAPPAEGMGDTEAAIYGGIQSVGLNVPAVGLGMLTGGASTALTAMGASVGLTSYTQARDQGASVPRSAMFAGTQAGIEVLTEKIPMHWFFGDLASRTGFVKTIAKQVAAEIPGEQVATFFQDLSEWTNLHPDAPPIEFLQERPSAAYQTLVATVVAAGMQTALLTAADRTVNRERPSSQRVLEDMHAAVESTKTLTRSPETLSAFVRDVAASGIPNVIAPIEPFVEYFQSKGEDPAAVATRLTGDPQAFALAMDSGELAIPTENYLTQMVGSGHEEFFAKELRLGENLPSAREFTERVQAQDAQRQTEADAALAEGTVPQAGAADAAAIHSQTVQELMRSGRVDETTANELATVMAEAFPNIATRGGADLATLAMMWLPQAARGTTSEAQAAETPESTAVNASGESAASLEALSRQAGMQARGQEFVVYDQAGRRRPLIGPEAVDYVAQQGETYGVEGPQGFQVLDDRGGKPPASVPRGTAQEPAGAAQAGEGVTTADVDAIIMRRQAEGGLNAILADLGEEPLTFEQQTATDQRVETALVADRLKAQAFAGGFTYDPLTDTHPTEGFSVSTFPGRELAVPVDELTEQTITDYIAAHQDVLSTPGAHVGAWLNPDDNRVYLDVSMVVENEEEALTLAEAHAQLAYYDLGRGATVNVAEKSELARFEQAEAAPAEAGRQAGGGVEVRPGSQSREETLSGLARTTFEQRPVVTELDANPVERRDGALLVSTARASVTKNTIANEGLRLTRLALFQGLPDKMAQAAKMFRGYALIPNAIKEAATDDASLLDAAVASMKDNLRALYQSYPAEWVARAKQWYVGANRIANELSEQHGYTVDQTAGVLAALSPQMDWFRNVAFAERVMAIVKDFDATNPKFSKKHYDAFVAKAEASAAGWVVKEKFDAKQAKAYLAKKRAAFTAVGKFVGKRWNKLPVELQARMLRMHDEAVNPRTYDVISPEGDRPGLVRTKDGAAGKLGWGTYKFIENAISILHDGSEENISETLGTEHKVRSFFNNISHPWDERSVTIDTHAVAAAFLAPFAGGAKEAMASMGAGVQSGPKGLSGTNGIIAEAYFQLAAELGVSPREVQSVTWEAGRSLFRPEQKRGPQGERLAAEVKAATQSYLRGDISHAQLVATVQATVGGYEAPAWVDTPVSEQGRVAVTSSDPRRLDVPAARGAGGSDTTGATGQRAGVGRGAARELALAQGARGRVQFRETEGLPPLITLFRSSNRSTFLHEAGHVFLRLQGSLADQLATADPETLTDQQRRLLADYRDVVLPFLGVTSTAEIGTKEHEKWARSWEAYLMAGKAPSAALRPVFARISRWLTRIYKTLQGLSRDAGFTVELNPEIEAVMARLLASDAAIEQAEREAKVTPIFTTADDAKVTPEEFDGYRKLVEEASDRRREQLTQRMMKDLQREEKFWWRQERSRVREEVATELSGGKLYRAVFAVRRGTTPTGEPLTEGAPIVPLKLSKADLVQQFGADILPKLRGLYTEGGLPADMVAPMLDYASGAELVQALAAARPIKQVIDETTDQRMRESHGDLLTTPGELAEAAQKAVADTQRDKVIRAEMAMLNKLKAATAPVKTAQREQQRSIVRRLRSEMPDDATLERIAQAQSASWKVARLRPDRFFAAAGHASQRATEMAAKGKAEEALQAKQDELINLALYRAAQQLEDEVQAATAEFAKMFVGDKHLAQRRNMDYVHAARVLAATYFWPDRRVEKAREALALVKNYNPDLYDVLQVKLDRVLATSPDMGSLTGHAFRDMREVVRSLWKQSLRDQQQLVDGELMDRAEIVAHLTTHLDELGPPKAPRTELVTGLLGLRAALTRVEHWVSHVDQQNDAGVFRRYIFQPVADAVNTYRVAKTDTFNAFLSILETIRGTLKPGAIAAPELNYTFASKAALLHAIAHTGNQGNLERLLRGRNWVASIAPDAPLDTSLWRKFITRMFSDGVVTKQDMDFVQALWDLNESLKPAAQAAHHEMFGHYFAEVTAQPVVTPFGTYRGGYVPAILDPFDSADGTAKINLDALEGVHQTMFPQAGFTQQRAEHYAQPLALDLSLMPQHLDKVLRFIHMLPRAKEVQRLVADRRFRERLHSYDPVAAGDLLQPWLQRAYSQQVTVPSKTAGGRMMDRAARALRGRTGLNMMALNVINVLQQYTGLFAAFTKVKPHHLSKALWRYLNAPRDVAEQIHTQSQFMATTGSGQVAEMLRGMDDLLLNPSKYEKVKEFAGQHGYVLQVMTQNLVSNVAWTGAYEQAIENGREERDAVRFADSVIRETQGSFNAEDLSSVEVQAPFIRLFLMFFGWANMMANLNAYQLASTARDMGLRKGAGRALYLYSFGFMLPVVLGEVIRQASGGWEDDDDESHLDEAMWLFFGSQGRMLAQMVPGGQVATAVASFFDDQPYNDRISVSPAITMLESVARAPKSVYDAVMEDGPKKKAVRDALSAIGLLTGLPAGALMRPAGYLADIADERAEPKDAAELVQGLVSGRTPER